MKKRTPSDFIWDNTCRKIREKLIGKRKKRCKEKKLKADSLAAYKRQSKYTKKGTMLSSKYYKGLKKIPCPKNVCLDSNLEETIKFLRKIPGGINPNRKSMRRLNRKSKTSKVINGYFDFPSIEKVCPASALIISSNYFMHQLRGGVINVVRWGDWNKEVKNTFRKMGFFELLKFKDIATDENLQDIPIRGFKMGRKAYIAEITKYFRRLVKNVSVMFDIDIDSDSQSFKQTMNAIVEAVENSARHAYPEKTPNPLDGVGFSEDVRGGWWFGGMPLLDERQITLVCYDKGMSIPRSIKESYLEPEKRTMYDFVTTAMNRVGISEFDNDRDHERLEKAMEYLTSTTENKDGGKGLSHIAKTIDRFQDGRIKIMSRRAFAVITKDKPPSFSLLKTPIVGTLIVWEIKL